MACPLINSSTRQRERQTDRDGTHVTLLQRCYIEMKLKFQDSGNLDIWMNRCSVTMEKMIDGHRISQPSNHVNQIYIHIHTSVLFSSVTQLCPTLCNSMDCSTSGFLVHSQSLLKLTSIDLVTHRTISSSVVPFFSWLQSFPASGSFLMSQFFASGCQVLYTITFRWNLKITQNNECNRTETQRNRE